MILGTTTVYMCTLWLCVSKELFAHQNYRFYESVLLGRYIGFIENLVNSKKSLIKLIFSSCSGDLHSLTSQNLAYLLSKYKKTSVQGLISERIHIKKSRVYQSFEEDSWKISMMEEITLLKKDHLEIDFNADNLDDILDYVCTS